MKKKCKYLFALTLTAMFLFYRVDSVVAMAAEQNTEFTDEPQPEQPGEPEEITGEPQPEQPGGPEESIGEPQPEQPGEPEESTSEPQPEQPGEPEESTGEPQPEQAEACGEAELLSLPEEIKELATEPQPEETVSTGKDLMKWLDSHKNTGGAVRLTDHVVLDGAYTFCPDGISCPDLSVDTGQYTITIAGEISFLSNGGLTFSGQPDGQGVLYVAEKGYLSLYGISVESGQCALWQEEGAGLEISDCLVSGNIHYADTPFVVYYNDFLCAVVEKGQAVSDALPTQISCTVNRQGQLSSNEKVSVSWDLEGTEKQQEDRRRFQLQGSFVQAASAELPQCTVVYNDYPLTFTDVSASVCDDRYTFQGGFTAPEASLPFKVLSEYSFDGENWFVFEEQSVTSKNPGFYIAVKWRQRSAPTDSNIYIRLQWNDNGTRYFSNVLCYAAGDLERVDDIGGSRGGGTSILAPLDSPQQSGGEIANFQSEVSTEEGSSEKGDGNTDRTAASGETPKKEIPVADTAQTTDTAIRNTNAAEGTVCTVPQDTNTAEQETGTASQDTNTAGQETGTASQNANAAKEAAGTGSLSTDETVRVSAAEQALYAAAKPQSTASLNRVSSETPEKNGELVLILMAAGFVLLSGIAGAVGVCVHFRSGTNR